MRHSSKKLVVEFGGGDVGGTKKETHIFHQDPEHTGNFLLCENESNEWMTVIITPSSSSPEIVAVVTLVLVVVLVLFFYSIPLIHQKPNISCRRVKCQTGTKTIR